MQRERFTSPGIQAVDVARSVRPALLTHDFCVFLSHDASDTPPTLSTPKTKVLGPDVGDRQEMTCRNRLFELRNVWGLGGEAIEYEADTRREDICQAQLFLGSGRVRSEA